MLSSRLLKHHLNNEKKFYKKTGEDEEEGVTSVLICIERVTGRKKAWALSQAYQDV